MKSCLKVNKKLYKNSSNIGGYLEIMLEIKIHHFNKFKMILFQSMYNYGKMSAAFNI